jgi:hypothetical protein
MNPYRWGNLGVWGAMPEASGTSCGVPLKEYRCIFLIVPLPCNKSIYSLIHTPSIINFYAEHEQELVLPVGSQFSIHMFAAVFDAKVLRSSEIPHRKVCGGMRSQYWLRIHTTPSIQPSMSATCRSSGVSGGLK